jgi:ribosomal protein S18 acetylase RimI-like enzyme
MDTPVPEVMLTPLTDDARDAFVEEELANYADQQVREAGWPRDEALERARAELTPVLDRELAEAAAQGHRLWAATNLDGRVVGWLWVTPLDKVSAGVAFLKQITVAEAWRRHGYGRAMLASLEDLLAGEGIDELRLNVFAANEPARRLYAAAGYEELGQDDRRRRLRKRLTRAVDEDRADQCGERDRTAHEADDYRHGNLQDAPSDDER